jgi:hypothetical protein
MRQIPEEYEVSGSYLCVYGFDQVLSGVGWILGTIWEIIALCLATWIAVRHFRELRRESTGRIIEDCLTVLIKYHVFYFAG